MQALFVHGMWRTPLSGWPLLSNLKRDGISTSTFGYSATFESFEKIKSHLVTRLTNLSINGDYFVIGHSLGGVLLRAAIDSLPSEVLKPCHMFLLASPTKPSRLAKKFKANLIFKFIAGECGQLLASDQMMAAIPATNVPKTAFVGDFEFPFKTVFSSNEVNDGILTLSEVGASWLTDEVRVHCLHSFLPFSYHIGEVILERVASYRTGNSN
jgi:hypothetical protein